MESWIMETITKQMEDVPIRIREDDSKSKSERCTNVYKISSSCIIMNNKNFSLIAKAIEVSTTPDR